MIPAALFEPDKGPFSETSTDYVMNVTPIANGWAGFPDLSAISSALAAQAYGGCYFRTSTGSYGVVVGTATALYRLNTGTVPYSWTDISGPSAPYAVPIGQMWQFERFGTGLYACTLGAPLQFLDVDIGGSFADAAGSPPRSKYIKTIGDFLMLGYLKVGATESPSKWTTSGLNAPTVWAVGTQLADEQNVPDGDEIMGILGGAQGGRLMQRNRKRTLTLTADAAMPIKSTIIDPAYGVLAPLSLVAIGGDDYAYLAEDGFQRGDGKTPIGAEKVNRFFFADVDPAELETVQGCTDPYNHMVWWRYKSVSGSYKMLGWDWELDRWTQADPDVQVLITAVTPGVTLEGLTAVFLALYGSSSIDTPGAESFDSRRWAGGRPTFGAISSLGIASLFTGSNRAATMDTTAQVLSGDPMTNTGITGAKLIADTNSYTLAKSGALKHGDVSTMAYGSDIAPSSRTGIVPMRGDHLIARFRAKIAAGIDWDFVHGVEPMAQATGKG